MHPRTLLAVAALAAVAMPWAAGAQSLTPQRSVGGADAYRTEDHVWTPQAYGVQSPATPGVAGLTGVPGATPTPVQLPSEPATPTNPPPGTATWTWDTLVCVTTRGQGGLYDANQWQLCTGSACPMAGRGCYVVVGPGHPQHAVGEPVTDMGCYSMITARNPMLCLR